MPRSAALVHPTRKSFSISYLCIRCSWTAVIFRAEAGWSRWRLRVFGDFDRRTSPRMKRAQSSVGFGAVWCLRPGSRSVGESMHPNPDRMTAPRRSQSPPFAGLSKAPNWNLARSVTLQHLGTTFVLTERSARAHAKNGQNDKIGWMARYLDLGHGSAACCCWAKMRAISATHAESRAELPRALVSTSSQRLESASGIAPQIDLRPARRDGWHPHALNLSQQLHLAFRLSPTPSAALPPPIAALYHTHAIPPRSSPSLHKTPSLAR